MKFSPGFAAMVPDLQAARAEIMALPLVKDAQGDKARYLRLATLLAAVEPILLSHGIIIVQGQGTGIGTDGVLYGISIETTLLHKSGEWLATEVSVPVAGARIAKKDGGGAHPVTAQDGGISNTYARRYGVFNVLSISVDEDTDGAVKTQARRKRARELAEEIAGSVAEKTTDRQEELKGRLAQVVRLDECPDCKRKKGQKHGQGCPVPMMAVKS